MNSKEFKEKLTSVTPDVPEHFHNRMEMTLEDIVSQEAHMKESTKKAIRTAGRYSTRTIAIAVALAVMACAVALAAATQWHVFDSLSFMLGSTPPPAADSLMQSNLCQETVNNVEITVREAGYDGRTLFLQYGYRMLDVDTPYGVTASEVYGDQLPEGMVADTIVGLSDEALAALNEHNVGWNFDQLWINGQGVDMMNNSGTVYIGSNVPGEIIYTEYWRLDNESMFLKEGKNEITLPIGASVDAKTRRSLFDRESGMYRMPENGVVTFTYYYDNAAAGTQTFALNEEKVLPDVTVKVADATFTPLMTYIKLDLKVNPDSLAAFIAANGEGPKNDAGEVMWPYGGMDVFGEWVESLDLVDGKGNQVFPGHYGQNSISNERVEFLYPHLDNIPDVLYLAPINDDVADMSQAILVKPEK